MPYYNALRRQLSRDEDMQLRSRRINAQKRSMEGGDEEGMQLRKVKSGQGSATKFIAKHQE